MRVYLEADQKEALSAHAKKTGRKASDLVRDAVDALLLGVNTEELKQLDALTKQAESDIRSMLGALNANAKQHQAFMAEIAKLQGRR
jgi:hypothetical protein